MAVIIILMAFRDLFLCPDVFKIETHFTHFLVDHLTRNNLQSRNDNHKAVIHCFKRYKPAA